MPITKNNGDDAFVQGIDAQSQLAIWVINHLNSRQISKLGLTHIGDGAADESGKKILHASGPGLTLECRDAVIPQGQLPYQGGMLPTTAQAPQQIGYVPAQLAIPQLSLVSPHEIQQIISEITGGCDPVYTARELGLLTRKKDNVSGPKFGRAFCEPLVPVASLFNMECCDADGNFAGRYVLFNGSVFEAKLYKYTDSPDGAYFFFAPSKSAIFAPQGCDGTFTTNANLIPLNRNMGWLCVVGEVKDLDWEIIRRFEGNARLVWPVFPNDPKFTRNQFAKTFSIVTEARRHEVEMKILRAEATGQPIGGTYSALERLLDDREIKKLARKYGLKVDPVWDDLPGEILFEEKWISLRSPFWNGNHVAVFFGKKSIEFLQKFTEQGLKTLSASDKALVVFDDKDKPMAKRFSVACDRNVRFATSRVFENKEAFLEKAPKIADLVFIVIPDEKSDLQDALELCDRAELPVGIFLRSADAPQQEFASGTGLYYVAKSQSAENLFSVKNMKENSIVNYKFSPSGVEETPGTEEDMSKGE